MPINRVQVSEHIPVVAIDPIAEHNLKHRRLNKRPHHLRRGSKIDKLPAHGRKLQITPLEHDYPSLEFPEESAELPDFEAPDFEASLHSGELHSTGFHDAEFGTELAHLESARLEFQHRQLHQHSEDPRSVNRSELVHAELGRPELLTPKAETPEMMTPKLHTVSSSSESHGPALPSPEFRIYADFEDIPPLDPCLEFEYDCVDSDIFISDA